MSLNAATIETLIAKGLSATDLLDVARAMEKRSDNTNAERQARYRERRAISKDEWDSLRAQVFERDGSVCAYCGATDDLVCDHVTPLVAGGTNDHDNLTTACRPSNASKGGKLLEEWQ
jgi:5-methylcytosine-specific restriction endonuclease McrA